MKKQTKTARHATTLAATALAATRGAGSGIAGGFGMIDPGIGDMLVAGVIVGGGGLGRELEGHGSGGGVFGRELPLGPDQGVAFGWG
jgi:hypothetical protein